MASVSRVLNGLKATPAMTARVRRAAGNLGYVPDAAARSLKARRTNQLAFAVPDIANPVYVRMMRAIEAATRESGLRLLVHSTDGRPDDERDFLASLRHNYVDGLVMTSLRVTDELLAAIEQAPVPVVVIGNVPAGFPVDSVATSSRTAVGLAVAQLASIGRRRIALINGPQDTGPGQRRREGYETALAAASLDLDPSLIAVGSAFTHQAGYGAAIDLLARAQPDAVFCANDLIALGAMRAFAERSIRVPRDIAVVGLDDTELAAMSTPSLSSVSLFSDRRGRLAAELMLDRISTPDRPPRRRFVKPRLVVRESSSA